jgi:hypothetical protein
MCHIIFHNKYFLKFVYVCMCFYIRGLHVLGFHTGILLSLFDPEDGGHMFV